jgi:transcriptional regulator with XRE-family HTH domain
VVIEIYNIDVKKKRKEKHMSQQELSDLSGVSTSHISNIEADNSIRVKTATLVVLEKLAYAMKVCPIKIISYDCKQCELRHECPELNENFEEEQFMEKDLNYYI